MRAQTIVNAYRESLRRLYGAYDGCSGSTKRNYRRARARRQAHTFSVRMNQIAAAYDAHQQRLADARANIEQMRAERAGWQPITLQEELDRR